MKQYATDMRTALADTLIELEGTNDRILWLDADLMASSGMNRFKAAYPDKVINCGIQEANMFGVAAGLSEEGFIPFVHSFGAFASRRTRFSCPAYMRARTCVSWAATPAYLPGQTEVHI